MRILFVGHCNDIYIGHINQIVKNDYPGAVTGVVGLKYSGNDLEERKNLYDYNFSLNSPESSLSKRNVFQKLSNVGLKTVLKNVLSLKIAKIKKAVNQKEKQLKHYDSFRRIISEFNPTHIHIHYLNQNNLRWMDVVPKDCKSILSFWGSDLMTTSGGMQEYIVQRNALQKATVVTVSTSEMLTILTSKFGLELRQKTKRVLFNRLESSFDDMLGSISMTRKKYGLSENSLIFQVGYSAAPSQNHLAVLEELSLLPQNIRERLNIFIPLSYNADGNNVQVLLESFKKFDFRIIPITEYVPYEEMLSITALSEIFILVRDNDALNGAMVESLYAGNIVITGSWLPYGIYMRNGIVFQQIEEIDELHDKVAWVLENKENLRKQAATNKEKLNLLYERTQINSKWKNLYK